MKPLRTFTVVPSLPESLEPLRRIAYNLKWAWSLDSIGLFRRLDADLWEATNHNPVLFLGSIEQERLEAAAFDEGFLGHMRRVDDDLSEYLESPQTWFRRTHAGDGTPLVAYFSAEFGLTECLSIFAGGLGILAGDHLKSASDLGLPLVGVGLLYQQGYFSQYLNEAGWQQEDYADNDFHTLPVVPERLADGRGLTVDVEFPGRTVVANVWRADVGRVPLYLLDTNIEANTPEDRTITRQLYGGDVEMRLQQEIVLGIGGHRALRALGHDPAVLHMNEGHAAFVALERIRLLMEEHSLSFTEATEAASSGIVFTTHTPVPAGHDYFPPGLIDKYFSGYAASAGIQVKDLLALGRQNPANDYEQFCNSVLAYRTAAAANGVSRLHGEVNRQMWQGLWPGVPVEEIPAGHITNGVHFESWISLEMKQLYERYLGPRWREEPADESVWERATLIAGEELWRTHALRRERLVGFVRRRLLVQLMRRGALAPDLEIAEEALNPDILTIGFSRRFATYKRATLLLRDPDRLRALVNDPDRPVQVVFAGKAHPRDDAGKELIRQIVSYARLPEFRRRLVFIEDYDMAVTRYLVQGSDIWLNTPRRLQEASGTSGMKAAANGVLNLSTLDGWWDEAYAPGIGWAIGAGEVYDDPDYQDQVEAENLYDILEREVVPVFYDRDATGMPRKWINLMRESIAALCWEFNTHRMVRQYAEEVYLPARDRSAVMHAAGMERAKALSAWKSRVAKAWPSVWIGKVVTDAPVEVRVGDPVDVRVEVDLGTLTPDDVLVELYLGRVDAAGGFVDASAVPMDLDSTSGTVSTFTAQAISPDSGLHGYTVRVLPDHADLTTPFLPGLIAWAS